MADVVLSSAMRSNLLSMQNTASLLDQTQNRLATGLKVNSAVDNPQSYFTAQGLNGRASDLSTLLDNMGLGVQTINAASQGITSIQKLVQQAKATATQALQTTIIPTTLTDKVSATTYSTAAPGTLTIQVGNKSAVTITLQQSVTSAGSLKAAISAAGITGLSVTKNSAGSLTFTVASGDKLTLGGSVTTAGALSSVGNTASSSNGTSRNALIDVYNSLLTQIDQLSNDSSFNGVNLLQSGSSLVVNFNENQSSKLNIAGVNATSAGLGLQALSYGAFDTTAGVKAVQDTNDSANSKLQTLSTAFASSLSVVQSRQSFTTNMINTLQTGASNLTVADTNVEGANLLALQTRQQLGVSALSIANQAQQSILKLF